MRMTPDEFEKKWSEICYEKTGITTKE